MKTTKLNVFLFLNILMGYCALSQDTIVFKDKQRLIAIVKEVSQTEIQYKKIEMPDGPMYITGKNDIEKIIYKNGYTEVIKPVAPAVATPPEQRIIVYNAGLAPNFEKITYIDTKQQYRNLVNLIERHPDPTRRETLFRSATSLKSLKRHQDGTRTGAIIFGGFTIAGGIIYGVFSAFGASGNADVAFATAPIAFGTLALISGGTSIAININLKKKRHEFVNLYNQ